VTAREALPTSTSASEDDPELWRAFKVSGSTSARERLFETHLPFARQIARREWLKRAGQHVDLEDLRQLACAGLLEAIDNYDLARGVPFRGYASRRILGSILDGLAKMSEVREQISFRNRVRRERARSLVAVDPDTLSIEDALQALIDVAVGLALGFMLEDGALYAEESAVDRGPTAYESLAWKETVAHLMRELGSLPERERSILRHHYLEGLAFDQIASLHNLSKGRISQIHRSALTLLRKRLPRAGRFKLER
jgi:RNA polymerase sigma factor for flagellar operon FliA